MGILLTEGAAGGDGMGTLRIIDIVLIIAVFYFIMLRPQKKEQKKIAAMLAALEIGDCVLTSSGMYGFIIDITDDTVIV